MNPPWNPEKPVAPFWNDQLQSYPTRVSEWRELEPFHDTLALMSTQRGRSSIVFIWLSTDGRCWPMFASDVADLIKRSAIRGGETTGTWVAAKRGANYAIRLGTPEETS